jgi:hypothetical protein
MLEKRVEQMQAKAVDSACSARSLWEELGENPALPRDSNAMRLSSIRRPATIPKEEVAAISITVASLIEASLTAWQTSHANAVTESERLHKALRAFGAGDVIEDFLKKHATVHRDHREACQRKLEELLADVRAAEQKAIQQLRRLYDEAGLGSAALDIFFGWA